jgi:hypothetical protein
VNRGTHADDLLVRARCALLDGLNALVAHRDSVIVVGAQAVYLHTGNAPVAVAEATKDSDLAIDARVLGEDPLVQAAMEAAGFHLDPITGQPGAWLSRDGIPVDLMVPRAIDGARKPNARAARLPPHAKSAMRSATGLEAAVVDNREMEIRALDPNDQRIIRAKVASPAALIVAKLHKIYERRNDPSKLVDKDAHDIYRILVAVDTESLATPIRALLADDLCGSVSADALGYLRELFAVGPDALGCVMTARTEGEAEEQARVVAQRCSFLAQDLIAAVCA